MGRLAIALAAIIILALSAGQAHRRPQAAALNAGANIAASIHDTTDTFRAELMPVKGAAVLPATHSSVRQEEPPAPALLVYLGLILVGSAGSVALARRRLHGGA
jgi:hypothetical protein